MPDICMCQGEDTRSDGVKRVCPVRDKCYRYTAKPTPDRQSYFAGLPLYEDGMCGSFWPLVNEDKP